MKILKTRFEDSGEYECVARNYLGLAEAVVELLVQGMYVHILDGLGVCVKGLRLTVTRATGASI